MRFCVHGNLDPAAKAALERHGHSVVDVAGVASLGPGELIDACHKQQLDLLTNDAAVAGHAREQPVRFDRSLVFLQLPGGGVEQDDAVDRLFARYKRLKPGQMYTVTETRVKVQQLKSVGSRQ